MIEKINKFIEEFTRMDIHGIIIPCPYWMNKLVDGKVKRTQSLRFGHKPKQGSGARNPEPNAIHPTGLPPLWYSGSWVKIRGLLNGKGDARQIREEMIKRINKLPTNTIWQDSQFLQKLAKRERIGLDCSGFAFHFLNELVQLKYRNCQLSNLSQIFTGGLNRTNADTLTSLDYCASVPKISGCRLGDLIRMMRGKHVLVVVDIADSTLTYAHSARTTKEQGVHLGIIKIIDKNGGLEKQEWLEQTRKEENFGKKHFHPERGDGVFRLKIFV